MIRISLAMTLLAFMFVITLSGCGQVITKPTVVAAKPTATSTPTPVPTITATVTPAPYTPEPTATPTIPPTPVIHTIAAGETLVGIAQDYGVSVQAIQDTNGIIDPKLLRINQKLVIPSEPDSLLDAVTPTPVPTPVPLEISSIYFGQSDRGGQWLMGLVTNPGSEALEAVHVRVTLLDAATEPLISEEIPIAADLLEAGQSSPFGVYFEQSSEQISSYLVEVSQAFPAHLGTFYRDLTVADVEGEGKRYYEYQVTGTVRNVGPEESVDVYVTVTLFNSLGQVLAFRKMPPAHNVISSGGETRFEVELVPVGGPVDHVEIQPQGRRIPTRIP